MAGLAEISQPTTHRVAWLNRLKTSVLLVALVTLVGYLIIFSFFFRRTHDLRDFAVISKAALTKSDASPVIKLDPNYPYYYEFGYDGMFAYFIALDPVNARYYVDNDSYRYTRILYPLLARAVALGNPDLVPFSLLAVNFAAVTGGAAALAAWCRRRGLSPWLASVYAFYVGQVMAFTRDLNEPLAYALVALAIYLLEVWPRRFWLAGIVFALAGLARETTLIFPALYTLRFFFDRNFAATWQVRAAKAVAFGALAAVPAILWQIFLLRWLGTMGLEQGGKMTGNGLEANLAPIRLPFSGFYALYPFRSDTLQVAQGILIPALICVVAVLWAFWRDSASRYAVEVWLLLLNAVFFALLLPAASLEELFAAGRISMGVVLAAVLSRPFLKAKTWFYLCAALWLAPTVIYLLNPAGKLLP